MSLAKARDATIDLQALGGVHEPLLGATKFGDFGCLKVGFDRLKTWWGFDAFLVVPLCLTLFRLGPVRRSCPTARSLLLKKRVMFVNF